ncbi:hypothetical protein A2291_00115 [candidate division WOR-1 bacterium RIFOXYB2_FULL_42_35]|uniref:Nucleotidyltransferase n=1 Tax=candidate division WOR-1 bacterium RIFOXYC2_FULL_41_25 TaxID=1802586 RepID=A0A1F4TM49_UNCSA|nr:MAG: hypothetical protein A2247_05635 [candidate division WOR-1 bacterium RIFOXYA2_FULL_41_14]OGC24124.1 MAG: hypothetical protein A2291_00115 [candidate division WOR-1 bacterium RIFOXYB2_FULL_42_35]OGC33811.1 MAG: hypothetical protein A2462_01790 [candidate division WOR-1 bacterium RIFOXYC2_FULL_41_25]OGC43704.1 MAG: hypothetical protein A2548_05340 [candidate division WOR-1 bacterium RIFOXYD2_FULL_41_8]
MNDKLANLLPEFKRASLRFKEVMEKEPDEFIRDSAIQRFEFTFELGWKAMKACLEEKGLKVYSPKEAIRSAFQEKIISREQGEVWLKMLETGNKTTHMYNEAMVKEIYNQLAAYVETAGQLVGELS